MQRPTEIERNALRRHAIELVETALRLCDEAETWGPACHLQLGLDMLVALERGGEAVSSLNGNDSHGIDSAEC